MVRQFCRLVLLLSLRLKDFVSKHPGGSIGFILGGLAGYALGIQMVRFGFPAWVLPVNALMWAVAAAPVVKKYLDGLR